MTLADDVAAAVDRLRREHDIGPSEALNRLVRAGMVATPTRPVYRVAATQVGLRTDVADVGGVLGLLDGGS